MTPIIRQSAALRRTLDFLGFIAFVLFLFSATASAQEEQLKSTVTAATERVSRQSYRWETRVSAGEAQTPANQNSPVVASGRKRADGYVLVDGLLSNANAEFVTKDGKSAVLSGGNWMTLEQAEERSGGGAARGRGGRGRGRGGRGGAGGGGQPLGETINRFQTPASEALDLLKAASGFRSEGNTITASLTSEAASALFASTDNIAAGAGGRGRGAGGGQGRGRGDRGRGQGRGENPPAPVVHITGTVAYTISDGVLANVRVSLSSTATQGDDVTRSSREIFTDFKEIGTADVELAPTRETSLTP